MIAYKREEMVSVTDLLKGFRTSLEKLSSHQLEKIAVMKNNKPEAVILSIDEYEHLRESHYWNSLDDAEYLKNAHESLSDPDVKTYTAEELEQRLDSTIERYEG